MRFSRAGAPSWIATAANWSRYGWREAAAITGTLLVATDPVSTEAQGAGEIATFACGVPNGRRFEPAGCLASGNGRASAIDRRRRLRQLAGGAPSRDPHP